MKELGTISHITKKGRVILRSDQTPGFGLTVFTEKQKKLGTVQDVFGPTKKPYISVKVYAKNSKNLENRVGETLYISSETTKKWGRKRRRKK
jgi:RNA-binding protein